MSNKDLIEEPWKAPLFEDVNRTVQNLGGIASVRRITKKHRNTVSKWCKGKVPTSYDVLACLQKYPVGSLEDFCAVFGYDVDSITANEVYKAVSAEYTGVASLWNDDELSELSEIAS